MINPALSQEPRYEPARVLPIQGSSSFLDWIERSGRLIRRQPDERKERLAEEVDFGATEEYLYSDEEEEFDEIEISDDDEVLPE